MFNSFECLHGVELVSLKAEAEVGSHDIELVIDRNIEWPQELSPNFGDGLKIRRRLEGRQKCP